jgi:O-antigen ligase
MDAAAVGSIPTLRWQETLAAWRAELDALPRRDPRRLGNLLLQAGFVLLLGAACLTPPFKVAGAVLLLAGTALSGPPLHRLPGFWWAAWLAVWQLASSLAPPLPGGTDALVWTWLLVYGGAAAATCITTRRRAASLLLWVTATVVGLQMAQSLLGTSVDAGTLRLAPWGERLTRTGGLHDPVPHANLLATVAILSCLSPAAWGAGRAAMGELRVLAALGLLLGLVRMGMLAAIAGLAVWLLSGTSRVRRVALWLLPALGLAGGTVLTLLDPARMARMVAGDDGRWDIWRTGWEVIVSHPWLGTGGGRNLSAAFLTASDGRSEFGFGYMNLHNSALTIGAQHGFPGLLLAAGWLGSLAVAAWRSRQNDGGRLLLALLAGGMVLATFDHFLGRSAYHLPWMAALGLGLGLLASTERRA